MCTPKRQSKCVCVWERDVVCFWKRDYMCVYFWKRIFVYTCEIKRKREIKCVCFWEKVVASKRKTKMGSVGIRGKREWAFNCVWEREREVECKKGAPYKRVFRCNRLFALSLSLSLNRALCTSLLFFLSLSLFRVHCNLFFETRESNR